MEGRGDTRNRADAGQARPGQTRDSSTQTDSRVQGEPVVGFCCAPAIKQLIVVDMECVWLQHRRKCMCRC